MATKTSQLQAALTETLNCCQSELKQPVPQISAGLSVLLSLETITGSRTSIFAGAYTFYSCLGFGGALLFGTLFIHQTEEVYYHRKLFQIFFFVL